MKNQNFWFLTKK